MMSNNRVSHVILELEKKNHLRAEKASASERVQHRNVELD